MKHLILVSIFIIISFFAKAQLNQSQSQVMQLMSNDSNWTFRQSGHNDAGEPYLSYKSKEKNWIKSFYFKNDSCRLIISLIPNEQLSDVIKDLNKRFTSMGNNLWADDKEKTIYAIILKDGVNFFEVDEIIQPVIQGNYPKANSN